VERRTQQSPTRHSGFGDGARLAARKEAAHRGVETRRRNREAREQAHVAAQAARPQEQQVQAAEPQTRRPERNVPSTSLGTGAQKGRGSEPMVTVALRGESAQRLRALAEKEGLSLSKFLVRMMEVFEAQVARPKAAG
jgi:hypothetical protein